MVQADSTKNEVTYNNIPNAAYCASTEENGPSTPASDNNWQTSIGYTEGCGGENCEYDVDSADES